MTACFVGSVSSGFGISLVSFTFIYLVLYVISSHIYLLILVYCIYHS